MCAGGSRREILWADDALELLIEIDEHGKARLVRMVPRESGGGRCDGHDSASGSVRTAGLPLVDIVVSGSGRAWSGRRYAESVVGGRLCYVRHEESKQAPWRELRVHLEDADTGLGAEVAYTALEDGGVLRARVRLFNGGQAAVTLESVTSFLCS